MFFNELSLQLATIRDPDQAEAILNQIYTLSLEMMKDPDYARKVKEAEKSLRKAMKEKLIKDLIETGTSPEEAFRISEEVFGLEGPGKASSVDWLKLQKGDIMHVRDKEKPITYLYAMYFSHSGLAHDARWSYESNPSTGVKVLPITQNFKVQGRIVALGYTKGKERWELIRALEQAEAKYGTDGRTPYNYWFPDKWTDSRLYCSQLVWKANILFLGKDVDSNDWRYRVWLCARWPIIWGLACGVFAHLAVAPDEIFLSPETVYYSIGAAE